MQHDAEFLSKIINFSESGKMSVKLETSDYKQFNKMLKGNEYLSNSSSEVSSSEDSDGQRSGVSSRGRQYKFRKIDDKSVSSCNLIETKSNGLLKDTVVSFDGS